MTDRTNRSFPPLHSLRVSSGAARTRNSFTPGPWEFIEADDHFTVLANLNGEKIQTDIGLVSFDNHSDLILVAAVHDLLAALEDIVSRHDSGSGMLALSEARAAIRKARGES